MSTREVTVRFEARTVRLLRATARKHQLPVDGLIRSMLEEAEPERISGHHYSVDLPTEVADRLQQAASSRRTTLSQVIRDVVTAALVPEPAG